MGCPLVSIVVPVYRAERYLDQCVDSILRQTYQNIELLLVDDGSPDDCPRLCDEWAQKDPRIKVIHKKNGGASSARNAGIEAACGDYIGFVDSDDYVSEKMYEALVRMAQETNKGILSCALARVKDDGGTTDRMGNDFAGECDSDEGLAAILKGKIGVSVCTKLFVRSIFESLRFPEGQTNEELSLLCAMLLCSGGISHSSQTLYYYRMNAQSVTESQYKTDAGIVWDNLVFLRQEMERLKFPKSRKAFRFYAAKASYQTALQLDQHGRFLNEAAKQNNRRYRRLMRRYAGSFLAARRVLLKDKLLYLMVITRTLRPIYRLLGRIE